MNKSILRIIRDISIITINYVPIMIGMWMLIVFMDESSSSLSSVLLIIPMLVFYLFRELIDRAIVQLVAHILTVVVYIAFFTSGSIERGSIFVVIVILAIRSISKRVRGMAESIQNPAILFGVIVIEYLVSLRKISVPSILVLTCLAVVVLLYFIQLYLEEYFWFLTTRNSVNDSIPEKEIFVAGRTYTGGFIGLIGVGLIALINSEYIEGLGLWLADKLFIAIKYIIRAIVMILTLFQKGEPEPTVQEAVEPGGPILFADDTSNPLADLLYRIFATLLIVALAIAVFVAVYRMAKKVIDALNQKRGIMSDKVEAVKVDKEERLSVREDKGYKSDEGFIFLSPSQKIRRLYRQKINTCGKNSLDKEKNIYKDPSKTVRELEIIFDSKNIELVNELTRLYEMARYQENKCTAKEAKRAKEICKLL